MWSMRPNTRGSLVSAPMRLVLDVAESFEVVLRGVRRRQRHAVAAAALDLEQRLVGALEQRVGALALAGEGDADRDRRAEPVAGLRLQLPGDLLRGAAAVGL